MELLKYTRFFIGFVVVGTFIGCVTKGENSSNVNRVDKIIEILENPTGNQILVSAHRGDWRNAPENSLQAFQYCIDMGVDIIELDVQETKDGHLVIMHDKKVDRTTKAKGLVKDWTLDSLKTLTLVSGIGSMTSQRIPTLEEALTLCKGKIMVNIDKGYNYFDKCVAVAKKTGTLNHIIMKGKVPYERLEKEHGEKLDQVYFAAMARLDRPDAEKTIDEYMEKRPPIAFEMTVPSDSLPLMEKFPIMREKGTNVWVNALWPVNNAGHDDEKAVFDNSVYDWFINNHVNIIMTDRPQVLLDYLRSKGLHD